MPKSIISGWRAFSTLVQTDLATPQAVDTLMYFEGEPVEPEPENYFTNESEVTGELFPTQKRLLNWKLNGAHKGKATPHLFGIFAAIAMGKCTTTQFGETDAYRHKLEVDKSVVELPTRTMVENDGDAQFLYRGISCSGWKLTGARNQFCEFEATLLGAGSEASNAISRPSRLAESYLAYSEANFTRGGSFDGSAVTGGTSISARVIDFAVEYKNNGKGVYHVGDGSGHVGSLRRGERYEITLEANVEIEDRSDRTALIAGTEYALAIPIVGGIADSTHRYTIELIFPRVAYREAKKGLNEGILKVNAKYAVLADETHGALVINLINKHPENYLATS